MNVVFLCIIYSYCCFCYHPLQAIAVSDSWAAAVTSDRVVRLFSLGGLQQEMFCLSGPVVSMAAHTNQLLLAFHRSMGETHILLTNWMPEAPKFTA